MNIAICDDEQQDIDILYNYCKSCKLPYNISTFLSASALLEAFKSQFYDLIFLDIEMNKPNGFEIGSILAGYSSAKGSDNVWFNSENDFYKRCHIF